MTMTAEEKAVFMTQVNKLLNEIIKTDTEVKQETKAELLTLRESADLIGSVSEHTLRKLVCSNAIRSVMTNSKNGKILIPKDALLDFWGMAH